MGGAIWDGIYCSVRFLHTWPPQLLVGYFGEYVGDIFGNGGTLSNTFGEHNSKECRGNDSKQASAYAWDTTYTRSVNTKEAYLIFALLFERFCFRVSADVSVWVLFCMVLRESRNVAVFSSSGCGFQFKLAVS